MYFSILQCPVQLSPVKNGGYIPRTAGYIPKILIVLFPCEIPVEARSSPEAKNTNKINHGRRRQKWSPRASQDALRPTLTRRIDRGQPPEQAGMLFVGVDRVYGSQKCSPVLAMMRRHSIGAI